MNETKDQIFWVSSHDLYWENKMYKRKRSIVNLDVELRKLGCWIVKQTMSNRQLESRNWKLECWIADVSTNCKTTTSNTKSTSKIQKLNFGPDGTPQYVYRPKLWIWCCFLHLKLNGFQSLKCVSIFKIKTLYHGKCWNDFYSLVTMHKKHSFARWADASQLVNKNRSCALCME